ncbi:mannosylglycerate hydrolase [Fictibacillus phosphorivorans]|uniref:mannosylglycerate hydrolase n=1 Tax=Fictibacillus phosphorivorans TaxID=1221500 RepID=UPI0020410879|nr:mannosylglycerate hydrolase [Fictibacillus phosphorivorans]MCM3718181.1 mannosylglycerate hydrolase [Fictibacillus phosphorivorans]MCM3775808.1 mannosylglycerate hydrolase [Fictibacillus phosphorivorans]
MKKVHIVPHMHWDREWYFSTEESRILLVNNMEEIMEMLENNPDYPYYVLDGQTSILEDYFAVKPENKERVKKLVQEGRLIIGPWYTQTDEMVVGAESIVRNLLYGIKDSEEYGDFMRIGYLPDSFGQSAQMPMIYNGFDISYSIFWRGTSERHGTDKTEFYWQTEDGSKVLVQLFPLGYAIGKYLPEDEEALQKRMEKYFTVLDRGATTENIILPNGHDQMPIQKNIFEVMEKLKKLYPDREFFLSKYEDVFAEIEKQEDLPTLKGEFLDGKYMRVHRSIYSTRMDIKAANTRIENKITNILEPLASLAHSLGFEYHHGLIELIWKEIMKNHAHDSIGCCCSDKVHREICNRFFLAEEKVDQLINFYKRKIVDSLETQKQEDRLTVFNLLPYERNEVTTTNVITKLESFKLVDKDNNELDFEILDREIMDPGLIDRQIVHYGNYDPFYNYKIQLKDTVPAMGYKTYFVSESEENAPSTGSEVDKVDTDFYKITVNPNGTLNIYDKKQKQAFENVLLLENEGDDGDEYDFSPLPDKDVIYSDNVNASVKMNQNKYEATIEIDYKLEVPSNLEKRKLKEIDQFVEVHMTLSVPNHKPVIHCKMEINNQAKDHRLRALIPTNIASSFSLSDNQFGLIKRPVIDSAIEVWEKEDWDERPDPIYPMLSYVGLSNEDYGVSVLTNSTREYEIIGENFDTIAITLFRSVGYLGKEEMLRRPGRPSGIKLPTPDSQMIGNLTIDFAIATHGQEENAVRLAKEYLTPIQTYNKIPHDAMKLNASGIQTPLSYSLLKEVSPNVVLSTLKKAEKEDKLVLRFYNPTQEEIQACYDLPHETGKASVTNLNEEPKEDLEVINNQVQVAVKVNQVKSIMF